MTGGSGFVGRRLVHALVAAGHEVTVLSRKRALAALAEFGRVQIVTALGAFPADTRIDANRQSRGASRFPIRPGPAPKRIRILRSRVAVTREVVRLISRPPPQARRAGQRFGDRLVGLRGDELLGEGAQGTECFSRRVCLAWERAGMKAEQLGVRTVLLRTGLVFDRDGGMLARLLLPFEFGLGGRFGDGRQWMSWIHRDDLVRLICHAIATPALRGPVNATAPCPVTNAGLAAALGRALHRPALVPIPAPAAAAGPWRFRERAAAGRSARRPGRGACERLHVPLPADR